MSDVFDLTAIVKRYSRWLWITRGVMFVLGFILPVDAILVDYLPSPRPPAGLEITVILLAQAPFSVCMALFKSGASPQGVEVDELGISYTYPSGRVLRFRWDDPKLKMRFLDARFTPIYQNHPERAHYAVLTQFGGLIHANGPVTPAAFQVIMEAAARRGLEITPPDWDVPNPALRTVVVRARRPGSSSPPA
ncbi:MAG: hypothetical protein L3K23_02135 [Thermoplasmata archaeon]|nr:hypothetical protein [Thermoplasmata archaeon]